MNLSSKEITMLPKNPGILSMTHPATLYGLTSTTTSV